MGFPWPVLVLVAFLFGPSLSAMAADYASNIASLIEPAKLASLRSRGANPRLLKCIYWLEEGKLAGQSPSTVAHLAVGRAGYKNAAASLTEQGLLRNLDIASKLGCLDKVGLSRMRRGKSPVVRSGPYAGDIASVDHIIPRAVVPELDCVLANLELLPLKVNERKNASIGSRQRDLARQLHRVGLLSDSGLHAVLAYPSGR